MCLNYLVYLNKAGAPALCGEVSLNEATGHWMSANPFQEAGPYFLVQATLPVTWSPILVYFGITIILGMVEWTHLARAVRSTCH